ILSFLALFSGSVFGKDPKLDGKLNAKISNGNGTEKVRVIIQRHGGPGSVSDDISHGGGRIIHNDIKLTHVKVAELPVALLPKLSKNPSVLHISIDEPVKHQAGEPYVVSGAALANQTYGVT